MSTHKEIATTFETLIVAGQVKEAYEKYIGSEFKHHNPFFKGDKQSLLGGMEANQSHFPHKIYEIQRVIEEGGLVVIHARLQLVASMPEISVVHIYRFEDDKIVEEWDLAQQLPDDSPNENGLF